ncbi:MAG: hypothetical protein QW810_06600 [Nitrososphaerota archaeon]
MESERTTKKSYDLSNIDWKFLKYFKTYGYLVQVDPRRKEVVVFVPRDEMMFIADVSSYVNIEKLKVDRIYEMTFAIYYCKSNELLRKLLLQKLKDPYLEIESKYARDYHLSKMKHLENVFKDIDTFYRFELLRATDWFYSSLIRKKFDYAVLRSYKAPTVFRWRHLLGY